MLFSKTFTFSVPTGAIGTTVAVTGFGFTPKAAILWWNGRTADGVAGGDAKEGVGFVVSTTSRTAATTHSDDAVATSQEDAQITVAACVVTLLTSSSRTIDGLLDVQSVDVAGYTFVVDDQFVTGVQVHGIAFGGDSIENAKSNYFDSVASTTGNSDITDPGFQPDIVFMIGCRSASPPPSGSTGAKFCFGFGIDASHQGVLLNSSEDAAATQNTVRYLQSGECVGWTNTAATSIAARAAFVSQLSTGFRINWLTADSTVRSILYLAIKGGKWTSGTFLSSNSGSTVRTVSGGTFKPSCLITISHGTTESTAGTLQDHKMISIGAADFTYYTGLSENYLLSTGSKVASSSSEDNLATSEVAEAMYSNSYVYASMNLADNVAGIMHINDNGRFSDGFAVIEDASFADTANNTVIWVTAGPAEPPRYGHVNYVDPGIF